MKSMKDHFEVGKAVMIDKREDCGKTYIAIVEGVNVDGTLDLNGWGTVPADSVSPADPSSKGVQSLEHQWREKRREGFIKEFQKREARRESIGISFR